MKLNKDNLQHNVTRAARAFNGLRRFFISLESLSTDINLNKPELLALTVIFQKNELIMSDLSNNLGIGVSTATGIIDRLVEKRLVLRKNDLKDRRIVRIRLTKSGEKKALDYQKQLENSFEKMLTSLTQTEQEMLILVMEKIAKEQL